MVTISMGAWLLVAAGCAGATTVERPEPRESRPRLPQRSMVEPGPAQPGLYAADEAVADVLSGELQFIGTGRWPGVERSRACAFRNRRVLVVNVYCTLKEVHAFRLEVYSPSRGRVRIYAETKGRISARDRSEYFTFTVEGGPPPDPELGIGRVALGMSYPELRAYEQRRYDVNVPGCFSGDRFGEPIGGCLGGLASRQPEWSARNRPFLERPNADWYRVVQRLRTLAKRYGTDPVES